MRTPAERGLEAWMDWAGIAAEERAELAPRVLARVPAECESVARALDSPPGADASFSEALLEAPVDARYREISERVGRAPLPFWDEKCPYAVCLTHDIDRIVATYQRLRQGQGSLRTLPRDVITGALPSLREHNPFFNFLRIREIQREYGLSSALYVLFERRRWARALRRAEPQHVLGVYHPESIARELRAHAESGGELGLHASFDSWKDASALESEARRLRLLTGVELSGCRTHYLQYDPELTPAAERAAGLSYDSSVGFNYAVGFRSGTSFPYRASASADSPWELPFQLMDTALRSLRLTGAEGAKLALRILGTVRESRGVLILNWHFHTMNEEVFPEAMGLLRKILDTARRDGARFCLPREVVGSWESRRCGRKVTVCDEDSRSPGT